TFNLHELMDKVGWFDDAKYYSKIWMKAFIKENMHRPRLVVRLFKELRRRNTTIHDFYLSFLTEGGYTDNIQAHLDLFDLRTFLRLKKTGEVGIANAALDDKAMRHHADQYLRLALQNPTKKPLWNLNYMEVINKAKSEGKIERQYEIF